MGDPFKHELSYSGYPTIEVEPLFLLKMMQNFLDKGKSIHSYEGATVWSVVNYCKANNFAYEVNVVKNAVDEIKAYSVVNPKVWTDFNLPKGWSKIVIDSWFPHNYRKDDKPIMSKKISKLI